MSARARQRACAHFVPLFSQRDCWELMVFGERVRAHNLYCAAWRGGYRLGWDGTCSYSGCAMGQSHMYIAIWRRVRINPGGRAFLLSGKTMKCY
eukprot:1211238-Pyramimonas_sp.AAC.1